jgi:hypothetical protein
MLSVTNKHLNPNVIMLSVIILNAITLNVTEPKIYLSMFFAVKLIMLYKGLLVNSSKFITDNYLQIYQTL